MPPVVGVLVAGAAGVLVVAAPPIGVSQSGGTPAGTLPACEETDSQ